MKAHRVVTAGVIGLVTLTACTTTKTGPRKTVPITAPAATSARSAATSQSSSPRVAASQRPVSTSDLAGARIALPQDWVAYYLADFDTADTTYSPSAWCFEPKLAPVADVVSEECPIELQAVTSDRAPSFAPDIAGGFIGNPEQNCITAGTVTEHQTVSDVRFGARAAVLRRWSFTCSGGVSLPGWEDYIVATKPAFVLSSFQVSGYIDQSMAYIAAHAVLPAQSAPLALVDRGYIRSISRQADGSYLLQLDRTLGDPPVNTDPITFRYIVAAALFGRNRVTVGELVDVRTDGHTVTAIGQPYTI